MLALILAAAAGFGALPAPYVSLSTAEATAYQIQVTGNQQVASSALEAIIAEVAEKSSVDNIAEIRQAVQAAYEHAGFPLVIVDITQLKGTLSVAITEITIRNVYVTGNTESTNQQIRKAVPAIQENKSPNMKQLNRQLFLANDNPNRKLAVNLRPVGGGKVDASINVVEQKSLKYALSVSNTGDQNTGETRSTLTIFDTNLSGSGDLSAFSYTTSPEDTSAVSQYAVFYQMPLPKAGDSIYATASKSDTDSGRILDQGFFTVDAAGGGDAYSIHYVRNLKRSLTQRQWLDIGIDWRDFENINLLTVAGVPVNLGIDISANPLSISYQNSLRKTNTSYGYGVTYVQNLSGGSLNNDITYDAYRTGTSSDYNVWRLNGSYQHLYTNKWLFNASVNGQYVDERLIYPEQFGLGGMYSVRGFKERDIQGDKGVQASFELYSPEIQKGQRYLFFVDAGKVWNVDPQAGELTQDIAASYGIGWRYNDANQWTARVDLGFAAADTPNTDKGDSRLHFAISKVF